MTKTEQIRRRIIELIHGLPYSHASAIEQGIQSEFIRSRYRKYSQYQNELDFENSILDYGLFDRSGAPITLGRILKAIDTANPDEYAFQGGDIIEYNARKSTLCFMLCKWILTRPDGSEATLEDQSEETIDALFNLLCHD